MERPDFLPATQKESPLRGRHSQDVSRTVFIPSGPTHRAFPTFLLFFCYGEVTVFGPLIGWAFRMFTIHSFLPSTVSVVNAQSKTVIPGAAAYW